MDNDNTTKAAEAAVHKGFFAKCADKVKALSEHPKYGWMIQFVKFGIVGASNTVINLGVYYFCLYVLGLHFQLCNLIGFLISVTNAYFWSSRYVFKSGKKRTFGEHVLTYLKTVAGYSFTYVLSVLLLYLWVDTLHISESIAPIMNMLITIPLNFLINKFWTFGKKKKAEPAPETQGTDAEKTDEGQETSE